MPAGSSTSNPKVGRAAAVERSNVVNRLNLIGNNRMRQCFLLSSLPPVHGSVPPAAPLTRVALPAVCRYPGDS